MRRAARLRLFSPLVLLLGACQAEDLGLPSQIQDTVQETASSTTVVSTSDASQIDPDQPYGAPATGTLTVAVEALSAFFVENFAAYEAEAERLRETDRRYLLQVNQWGPDASSPVLESYPLASARFEYAHAVGLTGAGQTVAVIDSGFMTAHEAFMDTELLFPLGSVPAERHGTGVASVIAGRSTVMTGVAPGTRLALASFESLQSLTEATRDAIRLGAVAQNNSWGYEIDATQAN